MTVAINIHFFKVEIPKLGSVIPQPGKHSLYPFKGVGDSESFNTISLLTTYKRVFNLPVADQPTGGTREPADPISPNCCK